MELFKDVQVIGYSPVQFYCGCSKEMFYGMLQSLSKDELIDAIEKKEVIEAACQICGRTYQFYSNEMEGLLNLKGHYYQRYDEDTLKEAENLISGGGVRASSPTPHVNTLKSQPLVILYNRNDYFSLSMTFFKISESFVRFT